MENRRGFQISFGEWDGIKSNEKGLFENGKGSKSEEKLCLTIGGDFKLKKKLYWRMGGLFENGTRSNTEKKALSDNRGDFTKQKNLI